MGNELVLSVRGAVYLATYEHKHGIDYSIHKTFTGAKEWHLHIVSEFKDNFITDINDPWYNSPLEDLAADWFQVSGGLECFEILELCINE